MTRVIDASAFVPYLTTKHDHIPWITNQIRGRTLLAPELLLVETTNTLRRLERSGDIEEFAARLAFKRLLTTPIDYAKFQPFAKRIWELRHNLSPYDAWYVALAESFNAELITLDQRLANAPGIKCTVLIPDS